MPRSFSWEHLLIGKAFDTHRDELSVASEKAVLVTVGLPDRPFAPDFVR